MTERALVKTYQIIVKKLGNKILYYRETAERRQLIFWRYGQGSEPEDKLKGCNWLGPLISHSLFFPSTDEKSTSQQDTYDSQQ